MRKSGIAALVLIAGCASAAGRSSSTDATEATSRHLANIRDNPTELLLFLSEMPKGGDLHNHLSGSIYAESFIRWAAEDGTGLTTATL